MLAGSRSRAARHCVCCCRSLRSSGKLLQVHDLAETHGLSLEAELMTCCAQMLWRNRLTSAFSDFILWLWTKVQLYSELAAGHAA